LRQEHERELLIDLTAALIHDIQKALGISSKELARRMGRSPGRISQVLSGVNNLTLKTLADVGTGLGVSFRVQATPESLRSCGLPGGSMFISLADTPPVPGLSLQYRQKEAVVYGLLDKTFAAA